VERKKNTGRAGTTIIILSKREESKTRLRKEGEGGGTPGGKRESIGGIAVRGGKWMGMESFCYRGDSGSVESPGQWVRRKGL